MPSDLSANERFDLGMKIQRKEQEIDEFYQKRQNHERLLENFNSHFQQLSAQYDEIEYQAAQQGSKKAQEAFEINQELNQRMNRYVSDQVEEINATYYRTRQAMNDEIENLHRERNALHGSKIQ